jgi:hypothetical protein
VPGRTWYAVAAGILLLGIAGFALVLFTRLKDLGSGLEQVVVPGETELALDAGTYTIFHEHRSVVDGRFYSAPENVPGLRVRVVSAASGRELPVRPPGGDASYSIGGRSGVAIFSVDVPEPGRYRVSGDVPGGGGPYVLALGSGFGRRLLTTILGAIAVALLSFVAALTVAIVTFVRRRRARGAAPQPRPAPAAGVAALLLGAGLVAAAAGPAGMLHAQADSGAAEPAGPSGGGNAAVPDAPPDGADRTAAAPPAAGVAIDPAGHRVPDPAALTADETRNGALDAVADVPGEETRTEGFVGPAGERVGRFTTGDVVWGWVVTDPASGRTQLLRDPSCSGRFTEKLDPVPERFFPPECSAPRTGVEIDPDGFPVPSVEAFTRDEAGTRRFDSLAAVPGEETELAVLVGPDGSRVGRLTTGGVAWAYALFAVADDAASVYFVRDPDCDGTYSEKLPGTAEFLPPECAKAAAVAAQP